MKLTVKVNLTIKIVLNAKVLLLVEHRKHKRVGQQTYHKVYARVVNYLSIVRDTVI